MESQIFEQLVYIKLDTPEDYDAWVLTQWPSVQAFEAETHFTFEQVKRRWIRVTTDRYGRRHIHRRSPNVVTVPE